MGKVIAGLGMSLDGFIADRNDGVWALYQWLTHGDTPFEGIGGHRFMTSAASAARYQAVTQATGALVTGRHDFDASEAWGGVSPVQGRTFIVTHSPPQAWLTPESPFTFVSEGVASAIEQARQAAGEKNVAVNGSKIIQQCLNAGLIDEIQIDLAPVLLGDGIRLFEHLSGTPLQLEISGVIDAPGVTHLSYRVIR